MLAPPFTDEELALLETKWSFQRDGYDVIRLIEEVRWLRAQPMVAIPEPHVPSSSEWVPGRIMWRIDGIEIDIT